jgi:hypothetical protein
LKHRVSVVLEKDGIPIAALMDVDEFEDYLELQNQKGRSDIEISRKEYLPAKAGQLMSFWLNSKPKRKGSAALKSEEEVLGARRIRTIEPASIQSRSLPMSCPEKGSTVSAFAAFGFATTLKAVRSCCIPSRPMVRSSILIA